MDRRSPSSSSSSSSSPPNEASMDSSSPLLSQNFSNPNPNSLLDRSNIRVNGLSGAARFLRRASGRRMMREPSMMVRETAAEQLEERQSDWAYSKPVVILDLVWNLAFVAVSLVVLCISIDEKPNTPLRVWICGYCLQCIVHTICVSSEYQRRYRQYQRYNRRYQQQQQQHQQEQIDVPVPVTVDGPRSTFQSSGELLGDNSPYEEEGGRNTSFAKRLESMNTMFSFIWWIVGFYWITAGGQVLVQESPKLYWLSVVFLAFDVLFVVFCVALACIIGIAVCCCLPCIIAILYAVADQEGATDEEINALSKFTFRRTGSFDSGIGEKSSPSKGIMVPVGSPEGTKGRLLTAENAECCICLSAYEDGAEVRELPCSHHFHCACIDKWLHINATCPLCKYNIVKRNNSISEEV